MNDAVALVVADILLQLVPIVSVGGACLLVWVSINAFGHIREALGYAPPDPADPNDPRNYDEPIGVHGGAGYVPDDSPMMDRETFLALHAPAGAPDEAEVGAPLGYVEGTSQADAAKWESDAAARRARQLEEEYGDFDGDPFA